MPEWTDCLTCEGKKTRISKDKAIICLLQDGLPKPEEKIQDILKKIEEQLINAAELKGIAPPGQGAFNNSRGDWFEVLVAVGFWQGRNSQKEKYRDIIFSLLPNRNRLDMFNLFVPGEKALLNDLRKKLKKRQIGMVTSNPDMIGCLIDDKEVRKLMNKPLLFLDKIQLETLMGFHTHLLGKCSRENIRFGVALKTSTRGDRKLQIPNEGSLWKAIISHLHTRFWESSLKFKYHALLMGKVAPADEKAFKTVATHTITDPNVVAVPASDKPHGVETFGDISEVAQDIFDEALSS